MMINRAHPIALTSLAIALLAPRALTAQRTEGAAMTTGNVSPTAGGTQRSNGWALCGPGTYELAAGGQSVGSETFEITCRPDGSYSATARTQLLPLGMDLTTTLELGKDLLPRTAASKGTVRGQPFDQTGTFDNGTATLTSNGQSQSVRYTPGASWMGGNIFFANAFIAARYEEAKGGAQQIAIFPQSSLTLERQRTDSVTRDGATATFVRYLARIATQEMVLWRDAQGRLAVIALPSQRFTASRAESAKWAEALLAAHASGPVAQPPGSAASTPAIDYSAAAGAAFTAEEVTIPVGSYALAGTLLVPKSGIQPHSAVVMVTGSGLQTRDSRLALPGLEKYAPFRQIAERLASKGVAVLRVDDRGIGGSTGRETLEKATTTLLAEDTRAQIAWLRGRKEIDDGRITVIGHSEGAAIAAMVAASDPKVAAVVLMAGTAKRGADVAIEQHEDLLRSDTTLADSVRAARRAEQKEAVKTILAGGEVPGQPVNAWIREYFTYDPLVTIRKVKQPILILQGERDRQVDQSHATVLAGAARRAGNKQVTVKVFPTLNHLFLPSKTGSFNEYSRLETSVVPDAVLDAIAEWVK